MKYKITRFCKNIFVMLIIIFLALATLTPGIISKTTNDIKNNENKILKNRPGFAQLLNNLLGRLISNRPGLIKTGIFLNNIYTNCDGIEKTTSIMFGRTTEIDVDNNPETGNENGADINIKFYIQPWFDTSSDIGVGLIFSLLINRLSDDIKESDFSISLEIGNGILKLGYWSPSETGNEIPDSTTLSLKIFFYIFQRTRGVNLNIKPQYNTGIENKKIALFSEVNIDTINQRTSIEFDPAIETDISFISTKKQGVWEYNFNRESSQDSKVTTIFTTKEGGVTKETILTIDKLPEELIFSLGITPLTNGGGTFLYESNEMYNIELQIKGNYITNSIYSLLRNTPRRIYAEWIPSLDNGEYHIDIDSDGTDFIIRDAEINPIVNFEVTGIKSIDLDAYWNFTNPGTFTVYKNNELNVDINLSIGSWVAKLNAKPTANYLTTSWLIDTSGYMTIDTNWVSLSTMDLLIKGPLIGLRTIGESFKAQDYKVTWNLWPPQEVDLDITGDLNFISVNMDLYLIDGWYHLWPW
jgi:hypothetical protein